MLVEGTAECVLNSRAVDKLRIRGITEGVPDVYLINENYYIQYSCKWIGQNKIKDLLLLLCRYFLEHFIYPLSRSFISSTKPTFQAIWCNIFTG